MKITIYNIKGGVGKTSIALNLALEMQCGIITNDIFSPLEIVLDDESFIKVGTPELAKDDLEILDDFPDIPDDINVIYDLGGRIDPRAASIIKSSKWLIVPTLPEYVDLQVTANFINQAQDFTDKIIIIVNNTVKGDFDKAEKILKNFFSYKIYEIKKSKALPNVFNRKKSLTNIMEDGGLLAHSFKPLHDQFEKIIAHLRR
jgi:cellulose biosynthesis protein BcsQ